MKEKRSEAPLDFTPPQSFSSTFCLIHGENKFELKKVTPNIYKPLEISTSIPPKASSTVIFTSQSFLQSRILSRIVFLNV